MANLTRNLRGVVKKLAYSTSVDQLTKTLELDPNQRSAYRLRAQAYQALGKKERAEQDLKRLQTVR